tara:strand:+ start:524 stop:979 length:456 start_codon:yes stop_codon:yes gene_type:complete
MSNVNSSKKYGYLHSELDSNDERRAQIVVRSQGPIDSVGFQVIHDGDTGMKFEVRVAWQSAGEFRRKTIHQAKSVYTDKVNCQHVTMRTTQMLTASGQPRFSRMGEGLAYVQLENEEVQEMWDRLNAAPNHDARNGIMVGYARELTEGFVG